VNPDTSENRTVTVLRASCGGGAKDASRVPHAEQKRAPSAANCPHDKHHGITRVYTRGKRTPGRPWTEFARLTAPASAHCPSDAPVSEARGWWAPPLAPRLPVAILGR
jgi:hypothetical protein